MPSRHETMCRADDQGPPTDNVEQPNFPGRRRDHPLDKPSASCPCAYPPQSPSSLCGQNASCCHLLVAGHLTLAKGIRRRKLVLCPPSKSHLHRVADPWIGSCMCKAHGMSARAMFAELGSTRWRRDRDAFEVVTKEGAVFCLSPNHEWTTPSHVIVDSVWVPPRLRGRGIATKAATSLCALADKHGFAIVGGPVGWTDNPQSERFVCWLARFGFVRDTEPNLPKLEDVNAFFFRRDPTRRPDPR